MSLIEERYSKFMANRILYACSTSGQVVIDVNYFYHEDETTLKKRRLIRVESHVYISNERGWYNSVCLDGVCARLRRCYRTFCTRDSDLSKKYAIKLITSITKHFGIEFVVDEQAYNLHTLLADKDFVGSGLALSLSQSIRKKHIYKRWIETCDKSKLSCLSAIKLYNT